MLCFDHTDSERFFLSRTDFFYPEHFLEKIFLQNSIPRDLPGSFY